MAGRLAIFIWKPEQLPDQTKSHSISNNYPIICVDFEAPVGIG
jgi:hypothetical protein